MVTGKRCEHELLCVDEHWKSDEEVEVVLECTLCGVKFIGVLKKDGS